MYAHPLLSLALILLPFAASATDKLYLGDQLGQVVVEIDVATGDRRLIEMEDYPEILTARLPTPETLGTFLFFAFDATLRPAVRRYHLDSNTFSGVSGFTNPDSEQPIGLGPNLRLTFEDMVLSSEQTLFLLQSPLGPLEIDLATGDRRYLAGPVNPVTGADPPLLAALDLVVESSSSLLIADQFQGLFRMDRATGDLSIAFPTADFISPPYNIERLPSGRIVHCLHQADLTVYVFDPGLRQDSILSAGGPFPVGEGEPFEFVWDITVDDAGRLFVYDIGLLSVFEVHVKSGDRTLISGPTRGQGEPLLGGFNEPTLTAGKLLPRNSSLWRLR